VIAQRVLAILAAIFLVGAVAVATLEAPDIPLGSALAMVDQDFQAAVEDGLRAHVSQWMWDEMVVPVLVRPAWLLPAALGLVFAGISLTLTNRQRPQRSTRRRF
jgi:uncharacterized membrane protein